MVVEERCFRCDKLLFPGQRRFQVNIRILADPATDGDEVVYREHGVRGVFRGQLEEDGLGEEGDVEMSFILCAHCRRNFGDNPLSIDFSSPRRPALLH